MAPDIAAWNQAREQIWQPICISLARAIAAGLPEAEAKVWHGGPVWFLAGNPVVGYWVRKGSVQLLFWSGQSFAEEGLRPEGKFKAAEVRIAAADEIDGDVLARWLMKARTIQWDYKNLIRRRGRLEWLVRPDG